MVEGVPRVMNLRAFLYVFPLALAGSAVADAVARRREGCREDDRGVPRWLDAAVVVLLAVVGCAYVNRLHNLGNPLWLPVGQDWQEFLSLAMEIRAPGSAAPVANRYPFYPWLGVMLAELQGIPVYRGCMQVSIVAAGLIPAGLYLLGREVAPFPVALAGALLGVHGRTLLEMLGPPTDYVFYAMLEVFCLATGVLALRRGGWYRFLAFGTALALLMATAAKALVVLSVAVPFAVLALAWRVRERPRAGLQEVVAFFLPLAMVWMVYGRLEWPLLPLERVVLTSQESVADERGYRVELPEDLGWVKGDPKRHGYWRVGDSNALVHLPDTYRFLLRGAKGNAPFAERYTSVVKGLHGELPIPDPVFMLLAVPACMAAGFRRGGKRGEGAVPGLVPAGFLLAMVAAEFAGLTGNLYVPRYALDFLVLIPALMAFGAAALLLPHRRKGAHGMARNWWAPALVILAWAAAGDGPLGREDAEKRLRAMALERSSSRYMDVVRLDRISGTAAVVDLARTHFLSDLLPGLFVYHSAPEATQHRVKVAAVNLERRFLVQPCQFAQVSVVPRWTALEPARLKRFGACVDEDMRPDQPLELVRLRPDGARPRAPLLP